MSDDASVVKREYEDLVCGIIAEVLMVTAGKVGPDSRLIAELGAESIDFLDLIFHIEETLGLDIPVQRWSEFLAQRLPDQDLSTAITAEVVREFTEREARRRD